MERHLFYVQSKSQETGNGTKEKPFGSLPYAKKKLREILPSLKGEVIVELAEGV